jgi:hypothetical protein
MAFDAETRALVDGYARNDLAGDLSDHIAFFSFLSDADLRRRVGEEYFSARYIYKLLEGLQLQEDWGTRAQVQLQVQQYASIYEACIHHLLFDGCGERPQVQELLHQPTVKEWSVSPQLSAQIDEATAGAPGPGIAAFRTQIAITAERVRFEYKADVAAELGIIDPALAAELKEFYTARNMIHIHAELKKGADWQWELDLSRRAYLRLEKFRDQIIAWQQHP